MSFVLNARKHEHKNFDGNWEEIICALNQSEEAGDNKTIEQLFADEVP